MVIKAQEIGDSDADGWYESVMLLVTYLRETGRKAEAKAAVEKAIQAFSATSSPFINSAAPPQGEDAGDEQDAASVHHTAMLKSVQAELLVETVLEQVPGGRGCCSRGRVSRETTEPSRASGDTIGKC